MINQELYKLTQELSCEVEEDANVLKEKMSILLERLLKNLNSVKHAAPDYLKLKLEKVEEDVDKLLSLT